MKRRWSAPYARALRDLITRGHFDVVHAHLFASSAASSLAVMGMGVPFVVTEHTQGAWQGAREIAVVRRYLRGADHVVAVSEGIERRLVEELGAHPTMVSIIPNTIPARVPSSAPVPSGLSGRDRLRVGVVARLSAEKGVDLFLDAAARIAPLHPGTDFWVIGDGPCRPALEAQAACLGLAGRVSFWGAVPNARSVLGELDLLAVPSRTEGTPLVVLEALNAGVPVVATRVGGIPSQIRNGVDGLLVPPQDVNALAGAITLVLIDAALRRRMAAAARHSAPPQGHALMVDRIEALYLARQKRRSPRAEVPACR